MIDKETEFWGFYYPRAGGWVQEFPGIFTSEAAKAVLNIDIPQELLDVVMEGVYVIGLPYIQVVTQELSRNIKDPEHNCLTSSWARRTLSEAPRLDYGYMEDSLKGIEGADKVLPGLKDSITHAAKSARICPNLTGFAKRCVGAICEGLIND
jgi:hypothetical protein